MEASWLEDKESGVEPLRPRANGQPSGGGEREKSIGFFAGIAWFGDIMNYRGPLVEIGSRSVFRNPAVGVRQ
jgi:hypothetical protein